MTLRTSRPRASLAVMAATALVGSATLAATAHAGELMLPNATCHGLPVTLTATRGAVIGTSGRDVIRLTGPATVYAGKGADVICGSSGNDVIHAGPGDDVVVARGGHDTIDGGPGADHLYGERGRDHLIGGPGADVLMGGSGRDRVERGHSGASGAHEQQTGDQVIAGTDGISLALGAQSANVFRERDLMMQWAVDRPDVPVTTQVTGPDRYYLSPASPIAISFPAQQGAYFAPYDGGACATSGWQVVPLVQAPLPTTSAIDPSIGLTVLGGISSGQLWAGAYTDASGDVMWGCGGFTRQVLVNGTSRGQQPMSTRMTLAESAPRPMLLTPPTKVTLFLQLPSPPHTESWWRIASPLDREPQITLDLSGGDEVVAASYSTQTGFAQDQGAP